MKKNINFKKSIKKVAVTRCKFLLKRVFNILCQPIIGQYDHPICRGNGSIAATASDSNSGWGASSVLMLSLIQILRCLVRTMLKMPRTAPPSFQGGGLEGVLLACWLKPSY